MRHVTLTVVALLTVVLATVGVANATLLTATTEGFVVGATEWDSISTAPKTALGTGYSWSGCPGNSLGGGGVGPELYGYGVNVLDLTNGANGTTLNNLNAWTVFNGDAVTNLKSVSFSWTGDNRLTHGTVNALIKDANNNWFLSDASASTATNATVSIDATTTTWKTVSAAPVINTLLVIGGAGTPDLSKIYGGGFRVLDTNTAAYMPYLTTLTFQGAVPEPSTIVLLVTGLVGLLAYAWRKRK